MKVIQNPTLLRQTQGQTDDGDVPRRRGFGRPVRRVRAAKAKEESKPMEPVRRKKRMDMMSIYLERLYKGYEL